MEEDSIMAITIDDFDKIWASTSPLTPYEFSESNYKQGWNFVGATPPSRQMWDFLQKNNDEKMQYLASETQRIADNYVENQTVSLPNASATATSGNATVDYVKVYQSGKVVSVFMSIKATATINVGDSVSGNINNVPLPNASSLGVGYSGSTCGVFSIQNNGEFTIRMTGASFPNTYNMGLSCVYLAG